MKYIYSKENGFIVPLERFESIYLKPNQKYCEGDHFFKFFINDGTYTLLLNEKWKLGYFSSMDEGKTALGEIYDFFISDEEVYCI